MGKLESLLIGIFSGIVTTVIIYSVVGVFKKILLPWYQELTYKGLDISGEWQTEKHRNSGVYQKDTIILRQKGHNVDGIITIIKQFPNPDRLETKTFNVSGHFYDRLLSISCKNLDRKCIGYANMLLEVISDGKEMSGSEIWYDVGSSKIASAQTTLTRKST